MTEPIDLDSSDLSPMAREALAWIVRLRSGDATNADLDAARRWRAQSVDHETAFVEAARVYRRLKGIADAVTERHRCAAAQRRALPFPGSPTRRALLGGAVAASAAWMITTPPLDLWPSLEELRADFRTGKGERRDVTVAEGVDVTLNTQTSLSVLPARAGSLQIRLITGEVAVKTARSADHRVTVQTLAARVIADRATFDARCTDGQVSVTCVEGTVDVESDLAVVPLSAGQTVAFSDDAGLGTPTAADMDQTAAWQRGLLIVRERSLAAVVEEVNRYRPGRIVVTNAALGHVLVNGTFQIDRLETFPSQVQQLFGARVRSLPGGLVLLS